MFNFNNLFYGKIKEDEKKWSREKVADAIASAVFHQNYCDYKYNPILVADDNIYRFLKKKYHLVFTFRGMDITRWASEYGFLKMHPMTPALLTPENAHEPSVYYVTPEFYAERIKPYLKENPMMY